MIRARFYVNPDDYRPVKFPPPGPYWCTGYELGGTIDEPEVKFSIIVAYLNNEEQIKEFWPEAERIDASQHETEITFTDRFPCPDWWDAKRTTIN